MKFDDTLEAFEAMLVVVVYAFEMQPTFCLILQYILQMQNRALRLNTKRCKKTAKTPLEIAAGRVS